VVGIPVSQSATQTDGPRPVNLRTDLAALADLIEVAFDSSMDNNGRAAIREMRYLSKMGVGLNLLTSMNELAHGMGMGYVWIADGKLVGNISVYPAPGEMPRTWVIVNVAVYPDYQRRGIASQLLRATQDMIREKGGQAAILQVDADNDTAIHVYERLGFVQERTWTSWRRNSLLTKPPPLELNPPLHIVHRRSSEWRTEYQLAQTVRSSAQGGLGWLRPLHPHFFHKSLWRQLGDWLSLQSTERLAIRSEDQSRILASLWIESGFTASATQLTLLVDPAYEGLYDDALLNTAVRRFGSSNPLTIEHPQDATITNTVLRNYHFTSRREVIHMRWDVL
jgi:ribosomal protein S18 acetylase RimI-like enzyme